MLVLRTEMCVYYSNNDTQSDKKSKEKKEAVHMFNT